MNPRVLHVAQILWPAFIMAGVLEMIVFSWVDPSMMRVGTWQPEPQAVYSLVFLAFWGIVSLASLLSHWMIKSSDASQGADLRQVRRHARRHSRSMA